MASELTEQLDKAKALVQDHRHSEAINTLRSVINHKGGMLDKKKIHIKKKKLVSSTYWTVLSTATNYDFALLNLLILGPNIHLLHQIT